MIHAVIADDEVLARQKLRQLLRDEHDIEIVGESATALETIELVRAANPELLFLDIHMPGMDGFDVVGALSSQAEAPVPRIIFTTAYDQYAVRAFEVNAVDYLLKPFTAGEAADGDSAGPRTVAATAAECGLRKRLRHGCSTCIQIGSSSSREAAFFSFPSPIFAGSAPRATMSGFAPRRRRIFCGRPWLTCRNDWIRADFCACIARSS